MRVIAITLFAGFVFSVAEPSVAPERLPEPAVMVAPGLSMDGIDPIVTGRRVTQEHLEKWRKSRQRYLECPECVATQPFPED